MMMKRLSVLVAASTLSVAASAATYTVSSFEAGNMFNEQFGIPLATGPTSGNFVFDSIANTFSGNIAYESTSSSAAYQYTADWLIDFGAGTLTTSNVTCTFLGGVDACSSLSNSGLMPGSIDVLAGAPGVDDLVLRWATGDSIGNFSDHGFTLIDSTEVPLPAAAWLFGTGLIGLVGVARRRKAA